MEPFAIDLTADREQWPRMTAEDRELVHWALSSPMVAEERITTKFAGLLLADGTEEKPPSSPPSRSTKRGTCSSTHASRTRSSPTPGAIADHVARAREQLSPAFVHNAGRSQIAEAFFNRSAPDDVRAESAGEGPGQRIWPAVVTAMQEVGIDLSPKRPKKLLPEMQLHADWAITLACEVTVSALPVELRA